MTTSNIPQYQFTPPKDSLQKASKEGNLAMVKSLLSMGLDVNAVDSKNQTALHYAVLSGKVPLIESLLQAGADIGGTPLCGYSLLVICAMKGHTGVIPLILAHHARVSSDQGETPATATASNDMNTTPPTSPATQSHPSPNPPHTTTLSPSSHQEATSADAKRFKSPTGAHAPQPPALHALQHSGQHSGGSLSESGPDATPMTPRSRVVHAGTRACGWTALHVAAIFGHSDVAEELVRGGCDVDVTDTEGLTPFLCAVKHGRTACLARLLSLGADVNARDAAGNGAWRIGAIHLQVDAIRVLGQLDGGIGADVLNDIGQNALMIV